MPNSSFSVPTSTLSAPINPKFDGSSPPVKLGPSAKLYNAAGAVFNRLKPPNPLRAFGFIRSAKAETLATASGSASLNSRMGVRINRPADEAHPSGSQHTSIADDGDLSDLLVRFERQSREVRPPEPGGSFKPRERLFAMSDDSSYHSFSTNDSGSVTLPIRDVSENTEACDEASFVDTSDLAELQRKDFQSGVQGDLDFLDAQDHRYSIVNARRRNHNLMTPFDPSYRFEVEASEEDDKKSDLDEDHARLNNMEYMEANGLFHRFHVPAQNDAKALIEEDKAEREGIFYAERKTSYRIPSLNSVFDFVSSLIGKARLGLRQ